MPLTASKLIRVGHSPDPDDAFMFYALAKHKIPMQGFRVKHLIEDIESLNQRALQGELEVTAVSCHACAYLADRYEVMRSGASVGDQYGPILVAKKNLSGPVSDWIKGKKIAIPGKLTTAFLVLQLYQKNFQPVFIPFDRILDSVLAGKADAGLVIHEGQLTYKETGLYKILDLGRWWHEKTGLPLPLGVDVIRKDLGKKNIRSFARLFKDSIQYALDHRPEALEYALQYGRGIDTQTGDLFVGMYVNDYTVAFDPAAEEGLRLLLKMGHEQGILPRLPEIKFAGA